MKSVIFKFGIFSDLKTQYKWQESEPRVGGLRRGTPTSGSCGTVYQLFVLRAMGKCGDDSGLALWLMDKMVD